MASRRGSICCDYSKRMLLFHPPFQASICQWSEELANEDVEQVHFDV